ncbi:MAG: PP2C family protein-serine/threonine phosphatase [Fusobacteriaceae bacterium]
MSLGIIFFLFIGFIYLTKRCEKKQRIIIENIMKSFRTNEEYESIPEHLKEEYRDLFKELRKQKNELDSSIGELREYRTELEITYNALVTKSNQLKYSNQALEKRVANLSNLNALARTVLSVIELEKTVDIILDAYFVLTGAKRISLYLWENGELKRKRIKGNISYAGEVFYDIDQWKKFKREKFSKIYKELSENFLLEKEETVVISPLVVKGKELGVIFVIEDKDKLIDLDEETISALVIQISIAINNAQIYADLLIKERISKELELASKMQKQIIPQDVKSVFGLDIANYFEPAKEIGGDYYDYYIHEAENLYVTMADVSGKGMPAAFLMAIARSILKTLSTRGIEPRQDLNALNKIIYPDIAEDMFITIMHCKFDYKTKILSYSNAGHNPIIVYRAKTDKIELHTVKGVAIGFIKDYRYNQSELKLDKGDIAILYTDGITEAENKEKELFGINRLKDIIYENRYETSENIKVSLLKKLIEFEKEHEQVDDLTFVIMKSVEG